MGRWVWVMLPQISIIAELLLHYYKLILSKSENQMSNVQLRVPGLVLAAVVPAVARLGASACVSEVSTHTVLYCTVL